MSAYYSEWSSMGDKFSDVGNAIRDFLAGIGDSLVDTVKGLLTLVVDLGILYVDVRWKSIVPIQVPEVLDQEVEKIKQKYEPLLKDPVNTIGGIGQSICDTADEKGVAYSSGYIVTEVVTALLADKGLDKIKNVAKTGKTADNVADIAEGAAKGAGNAAEDAGKAGKELEGAAKGAESAAEDAGKVVESGGKTTYKILNTSSAEDVNKIFKDTMGYEPPYKPGTSVTEIQLTENATYVRVYDKVNSRMQGGWVMKAEDIVGLTPQEIQNKFALPNTPKYICDVNLEAVTRLRTGEVNPLFGFDGGGQQYDLIINGKNVGTFTNERIIGQ